LTKKSLTYKTASKPMIKKIMRLAGILIAGITLLVIIGGVLFQLFSPKYFIPYVIKIAEQKTHGRYTLSINSDSVRVRLWNMNLNLGPTEFVRDSSVNVNSGIEFLDKFDVHARFEALNISAMHALQLFLSRKIVVERIALVAPRILIRKNLNYQLEDKPILDSISETMVNYEADSVMADTLAWKEFHESRSAVTPSFEVDSFLIENASLLFFDGRKKFPIYAIYGLDFNVIGFTSDKHNDIEVADASIQVDSLSALVSKNIARLKVAGLNIHPDSIHIDRLHFGHIIDRYKINKIRGFRASWLNINVDDINIWGIHPGELLSDSILNIDKTSIGFLDLYLFKDKDELIINPAHKALPSEQVRNIPMPVLIDTLEIEDGNLVLDMQAPKAKAPGSINLNQLHATITNITNIEENLSSNPVMELQADLSVMNAAHVSLNSKFQLDSQDDQFWVKCQADPFDVRVLNGFLGSQFFIEFPSGNINHLEFEFEGNNKANVGTMDLEFEGLKVGKLKDYSKYLDDKPNTGLIAGVGNMLIPNNRSKTDKNYKQAVIYYEKEYNRDFIHGTIMSLLSGAESSFGLKTKNLEKREAEAAQLDATDTEQSAQKALEKVEKARQKQEIQ
jgi:hypothetical protein